MTNEHQDEITGVVHAGGVVLESQDQPMPDQHILEDTTVYTSVGANDTEPDKKEIFLGAWYQLYSLIRAHQGLLVKYKLNTPAKLVHAASLSEASIREFEALQIKLQTNWPEFNGINFCKLYFFKIDIVWKSFLNYFELTEEEAGPRPIINHKGMNAVLQDVRMLRKQKTVITLQGVRTDKTEKRKHTKPAWHKPATPPRGHYHKDEHGNPIASSDNAANYRDTQWKQATNIGASPAGNALSSLVIPPEMDMPSENQED